MPRSDDPRQVYESELGRLDSASGDTIAEAEAEAIRHFVKKHDGEDITVTDPSVDDKSARTLKRYTATLRLTARRLREYDTTLLDADADAINRLMQDLRHGDHPDVRDDGMVVNSVSNKQGTVRKFMRQSDMATADDEQIVMYDSEDTKVDERDILDEDEIEACRNAITRPRNRAIFELLLYTGQRVRVLQTLRVKDVDFDKGASGSFYLNEEADGLKGADGRRPLLGAHEAMRDYLRNYHPCPDDPDAAFFTCIPGYTPEEDYGERLHHTAFGRVMDGIGEEAGVERLHPHLMRHTAVTVMHREYDIDDSEIRFIIGHNEGSTVMETTYSHLQDSDHIESIEVAAGYKEKEEATTFTQGNCPRCDARLDPADKACSRCGYIFTPDAAAAKEQIDDVMHESAKDAVTEQERDDMDELRQVVEDNPDVILDAIDTEKLSEALDDRGE
jgi:integrase/recombinase XerD